MATLEFLSPKIITKELDEKFKLRQLVFIGSLLVACIVITNVIGTKVMTLFGFNFTAGVITYALVFLGTDIIGEIWGKRTAYYFVIIGFIANILLIIFVQLAILSPSAVFWTENQVAYSQTLGSVWTIVVASMVAYLISQFHDVWAFDFWRKKTNGRHLWFRNTMSTITSQFLDTVIFIVLAFGFSLTVSQVFTMIVGQIIIKWCLAVLDTPIIYLLKWRLGSEVEGAHESYE